MNTPYHTGGGRATGAPAARSEETREALLAALDEIPALGPVALRVMELVNDLNTSAGDLARVISRDQGLSAKLLRTCNSPFIAPVSPVTSLSQAVVTLGLRAVRNLALFHAVTVGAAGAGWSETERRLWMHGVGVALGSRLLASESGSADPESSFLGGLFHDLGRMLLRQVRPLTYEALCRLDASGLPAIADEQANLGADHAEIGGAVLRRWKVGEELAVVAESHHREVEALGPLALLVVAAECFLVAEGEEPGAARAAALTRIGLAPGRAEVLRARLQEELRREMEFFRLAA